VPPGKPGTVIDGWQLVRLANVVVPAQNRRLVARRVGSL